MIVEISVSAINGCNACSWWSTERSQAARLALTMSPETTSTTAEAQIMPARIIK